MPKTPPGAQTHDLSSMAGRVAAAWDALNGRPFGPLAPLEPVLPPASNEPIITPRQFPYPTGVNTNITPRREYGQSQTSLTPFEQLRNLAALYDIAAICVASLIEEFQRKGWSIVAKDKRRQKELQARCDAVTAFWRQPDRLNDYASWLSMVLYEVLTIDALSLYKRQNRGGKLHALELVDGTTIKPLLDERGRTVAYQQIIYGRPEAQFTRPSADEPDEQLPIYAPTELMYKPRWTRANTPYGFPPTEWIVLRVNQALRKQTFDLAYFTDGNIPDMLASVPEGMATPEQVQAFEDYFNAVLEGSDQARRKMRFIPWKADVKEMRPFSYETALDYFMMQITCAAYGRMPQALGFVESVNRSQGVVQNDITELRELALAEWLKQAVFDQVIQDDLGEPELEWQWVSDRIIEDELTQAQIHSLDITNGVISVEESRILRYAGELDGPAPQPTPATPPTPPADVTVPSGRAGSTLPTQEIARLAKADGDPRDEAERKALRLMRRIYNEQMDRVIDSLDRIEPGRGSNWESELADLWLREPDLVANALTSFYMELGRAAAIRAVEQAGFGNTDWSAVNQDVLRLATERARLFAADMTKTSQAQTSQVIADWIATGGTMPDLKERVANVWTGPRPDVAAVTEVTTLFSQGQRSAWVSSGVVKEYRIDTARDSLVCPICGTVAKNGPYEINDTRHLPPYHPNCRCDIAPVVKTAEELFG